MNSPTKTFKRLGIVGAAAVVGLVPIGVLSTSAYAVSAASLSLANSNPGVTNNATNTFTVTNGVSAGTTEYLTISTPGSATAATQAASYETLPTAPADYTVTVGGVSDPVNTSYTGTGAFAVTAPTTTTPATSVTLPLTTAATAGQQVVVTINGVLNPTSNSSIYFTDQASADSGSAPVNTNTVTVASAAGAAASVTSVNPLAFAATTVGAAAGTPAGFAAPTLPTADTPYTVATGEQFTVMGSGFSTTGTAPTVCFIPATYTSIPSSCATPAGATTPVVPVTNTIGTTAAATPSTYALDVVSSTELQGIVRGLAVDTKYNVVVYNSGAAPSATSAATMVAVSNYAPTVGATPTGALNFVPESGVRAVDTRVGLGLPASALTPGVAYTIPLSTFENTSAVPTNIPTSASAIALNVTATAPSGAGNVQVWGGVTSCAANADAESTVNFQPPQDTNNSTIVPIGTGDVVCVQDNGASVNVVMDVTGYATNYYTSAGYTSTQRLLDSRPGAPTAENLIQGPLTGGTVYRLDLPALAGDTVVLNVTAVGPTAVGNLRVFPEPSTGAPAPSAVPNTAVDTYIPGVDSGSLYVTQVGTDGYIDLYSNSAGTVNVVVDELGTFSTTPGTLSSVTAITPTRMIDTRPGGVAAGGMTSFTAVPFAAIPVDVPPTALGVFGDLADIQPTSPGYLVAYPAGDPMPGTANIANFPGQTRSTTAFAAVSPSSGQVSVSSVGAMTNFTFDASAFVS